jgi:protein-disulfide isomerase
VLTVGVQVLILYRQQNSARAVTLPAINAVESIAARELTVSVRNAPRLGTADARVAIVEFGDFECPFCRRHANGVLPSLKKRFIDTGVAAYYYLHLPLKMHPNAIGAANAAECARTQGRFWEMHDLLFAGAEPASLTSDSLRSRASSLAIDLGAFDMCMSSVADRTADDVEQANRLGVISTPIFMLGTVADSTDIAVSTQINGAQPLEVFAKAIDALERREVR